jgi:hypothetical protein
MFEKRRIGSDEWEQITAREALEILHGVTYQSIYVLRFRLAVDVSMLTASSAPIYAIAEDAETIEAMANDAISPNKIPFTGYSVGNLGNGVLHHAEDLPCAEPSGN